MGIEVSGRIGGDGYAASIIIEEVAAIGRISPSDVYSVGRIDEGDTSISSKIKGNLALSSAIDDSNLYSVGRIGDINTSVIGTL